MHSLLRHTSLVLGFWLMLSGVCFGNQVYLTDGGIIECESFWSRGGQVVVKINRDVVIDLERSEVDLKRTFHPARKRTTRVKHEKAARSKAPRLAVAPAAAVPAVAVAPAVAVTTVPASSAPEKAVKPTPSPAPAAAPVAQVAPAPAPAPVSAATDAVQLSRHRLLRLLLHRPTRQSWSAAARKQRK